LKSDEGWKRGGGSGCGVLIKDFITEQRKSYIAERSETILGRPSDKVTGIGLLQVCFSHFCVWVELCLIFALGGLRYDGILTASRGFAAMVYK
jgi:hypothetical protein